MCHTGVQLTAGCTVVACLQEIRFSVLSNLRYVSALHYAFEGFLQVELGGRLFSCPSNGIDSQTAAFLTQLLPGAASVITPDRLQQAAAAQQACTVDSSAVVGGSRHAVEPRPGIINMAQPVSRVPLVLCASHTSHSACRYAMTAHLPPYHPAALRAR